MSDESHLNQTPSEETVLAKKGFRMLRKLDEGSFAKVYLAEKMEGDAKSRQKLLACKVIDTTSTPEEYVTKFLPRELDIMVRVKHPHIVFLQSVFERQNKYYLFMRYAERGNLLDYVIDYGALVEDQARVWFRQIMSAVIYLHGLDIAHRDLKCENILITINYNIKVTDFGFARFCVDENSDIVLSDTHCGSLAYASPDILCGSPYNPKYADIWSVGIILYVMLNKSMPFDDTNIKKAFMQQKNRHWKFRSHIVDTLSTECKFLVTQMLEPELEKRWLLEHIITSDWFTQKISEGEDLIGKEISEQSSIILGAMKNYVNRSTLLNGFEKKAPDTLRSSRKTISTLKL